MKFPQIKYFECWGWMILGCQIYEAKGSLQDFKNDEVGLKFSKDCQRKPAGETRIGWTPNSEKKTFFHNQRPLFLRYRHGSCTLTHPPGISGHIVRSSCSTCCCSNSRVVRIHLGKFRWKHSINNPFGASGRRIRGSFWYNRGRTGGFLLPNLEGSISYRAMPIPRSFGLRVPSMCERRRVQRCRGKEAARQIGKIYKNSLRVATTCELG